MEMINRIELLGIVGNSKLQVINDKYLLKFTLVTSRAYRTAEGQPTIENEWHSVTAWEGKHVPYETMKEIGKGSAVKVTGRIRYNRYTDQSGTEHWNAEIVATSLSLPEIKEEEVLQYEI